MNAKTGRLSRRAMLGGVALATGGAGAAALVRLGRIAPLGSDSEDSWWSAPPVSLETGAIRDWTARIGSIFVLEGENGPATVELVAVEPQGGSGERPPEAWRQRGFIAVFAAANTLSLEGDRTYAVRHDTGSFDLFVSPPYADGDNIRLSALFN